MGREIPCSSEEQGEGEGEGSGETEENRERDTYLHQISLYKCFLVHIRPPLATIYLDFTSWSYLSTTPKPRFLPLQLPDFSTCAITLWSQFLEFEAEQGISMLSITIRNNLVQVESAKVVLPWRKVGRSDLSEHPMDTCYFAVRGT